jgi:hypothetical protein
MRKLLVFLLLLAAGFTYAQNQQEYLKIRVDYKIKFAEYFYELTLDIGKNGSHSLAGKVENKDGVVYVKNENGMLDFESDIDLLNYLSKKGWKVMYTGKNKILDTEYTEYLLVRDK